MDRAAFLDTDASVFPACTSDACDCGRKPCPTPAACLLPEPTPFPFGLGIDGRVALIAAVLGAIAAYFLAAN